MAAEVGNLFVSLGLSTGAFDKGVTNVQHKLDQFGRRVKDAGSSLKGFGANIDGLQWNKISTGVSKLSAAMVALRGAAVAAAAAMSVNQIAGWAKGMADAGEKTTLMAEALNTPIASLLDFQSVMMLTQGTLDDANVSLRRLQNNLGDALSDPTGSAANAFKQFGITTKELQANQGDAVELFKLLARHMAGYENDATKNAATNDLLGKSYQDMLPIIKALQGDWAALVAQGRQFRPAAEAATVAGDKQATTFDRIATAVNGLSQKAFVAFQSTIEDVTRGIERLISFGGTLIDWASAAGSKLDELAGAAWKFAKDAAAAALWYANEVKLAMQFGQVVARADIPPAPEDGDFGGNAPPALKKMAPKAKAGGGGGGGGGKDKAAESRVSAWQDELEQKLIAERKFFGNSNQMELDFWKEKLKLAETNSKEWLAVRRKIFDLEKSLAQEAQRDAIKDLDHQQQMDDARLERRKLHIQQAVDFDKMTEEEGAVAYQDLLDQKWEADAAYYAKKIEAAKDDPETQKQLYQQQLLDYENYLTERDRLQGSTLKIGYDKLKTQIEGVADVFQNSLGDAFDKVIEGTFKVKAAIGSLLKDLGKFIANEAFKSLWKIGGTALTSSLGGMFGSTPAAAGTSNMSDLGFPGKQHGGSFRVGGSGGIDSKLVAFRASPGETVNVQSPLGKGGGGEVVRIELNPSEGWVSGIADQQIRTRSGQIVQVAVRQSQSATKRQFNTLSTESAARQA